MYHKSNKQLIPTSTKHNGSLLESKKVYVRTAIFFSFFLTVAVNTALAQFESLERQYEKLEEQSKANPLTIQFIQEEMLSLDDYSRLSQIVLLRHGEPALHKKGWRKRKEAMAFIKEYDSASVYPPENSPIMMDSNDVDIIFTSTLNRSISTAEQLFHRPEDQRANPLFREFERRIFCFPNIKLPLRWWLAGSRLFWFLGLNNKEIESFSEAKLRAKEAVSFLEKNSFENGKTLLVSHGLLNHYLAKYLVKNGWVEVFDGGKGYLSPKLLVRFK